MLLVLTISKRKIKKIALKFSRHIVKKESTRLFHGLHSYICGSWFHLSFEDFMASLLWSIKVQTVKKSGRFVRCTYLHIITLKAFDPLVDFDGDEQRENSFSKEKRLLTDCVPEI